MSFTASKPTDKPRWADVGGDVVEPTEGKKNVGWVDAEEPAAEFQNWLHFTTKQWVDYFESVTDEIDSLFYRKAGGAISGAVTMGSTLGVTGAVTGASFAATGALTGATLATTGAATVGSTLGVTGLATLASASIAGNLTFGAGARTVGGIRPSVASTDSIGSNILPYAGVSANIITAFDHIELSAASDPSDTAPRVNLFNALQIPKCFGTIETDGAGGATLVTGSGVNVGTLSFVGSVGTKGVNIAIAGDMASAAYVVMLHCTDGVNGHYVRTPNSSKAATDFNVFLYDGTDTNIGLDDNATVFDFVVFGRQ